MRFPNVLSTLRRWNQTIQLQIVKKAVEDFDVKETSVTCQTIIAVIQPTPAQKLLLKPEGQRQWKWWEIWSESKLKLDWILKDDAGKHYRVMEVSDWSNGGFYNYQLAEAPEL